MSNINYKELLKKYMEDVIASEGVSFICESSYPKQEYEELLAIENGIFDKWKKIKDSDNPPTMTILPLGSFLI